MHLISSGVIWNLENAIGSFYSVGVYPQIFLVFVRWAGFHEANFHEKGHLDSLNVIDDKFAWRAKI